MKDQILYKIQKDFPLTIRPFKKIAEELDMSENEVLEIIKKEIVGEIDDLEAKLSGEKPVTRLELLHLANSWDRYYDFNTNNNEIKIKKMSVRLRTDPGRYQPPHLEVAIFVIVA